MSSQSSLMVVAMVNLVIIIRATRFDTATNIDFGWGNVCEGSPQIVQAQVSAYGFLTDNVTIDRLRPTQNTMSHNIHIKHIYLICDFIGNSTFFLIDLMLVFEFR